MFLYRLYEWTCYLCNYPHASRKDGEYSFMHESSMPVRRTPYARINTPYDTYELGTTKYYGALRPLKAAAQSTPGCTETKIGRSADAHQLGGVFLYFPFS